MGTKETFRLNQQFYNIHGYEISIIKQNENSKISRNENQKQWYKLKHTAFEKLKKKTDLYLYSFF